MTLYVGRHYQVDVGDVVEVKPMCIPEPLSGCVQETDVPAYRQRHNRHTGVAKAKRQAKKGKRK